MFESLSGFWKIRGMIAWNTSYNICSWFLEIQVIKARCAFKSFKWKLLLSIKIQEFVQFSYNKFIHNISFKFLCSLHFWDRLQSMWNHKLQLLKYKLQIFLQGKCCFFKISLLHLQAIHPHSSPWYFYHSISIWPSNSCWS